MMRGKFLKQSELMYFVCLFTFVDFLHFLFPPDVEEEISDAERVRRKERRRRMREQKLKWEI